MNLIAHQVTPIFKGKENYPQPDAYKIKGGGTFADKADNVISIWRPFRRSDFEDTTVSIIVNKIKKQKLVGIPGEFELYFNRATNQYDEDLFNEVKNYYEKD
jgi:twinkle protein